MTDDIAHDAKQAILELRTELTGLKRQAEAIPARAAEIVESIEAWERRLDTSPIREARQRRS